MTLSHNPLSQTIDTQKINKLMKGSSFGRVDSNLNSGRYMPFYLENHAFVDSNYTFRPNSNLFIKGATTELKGEFRNSEDSLLEQKLKEGIRSDKGNGNVNLMSSNSSSSKEKKFQCSGQF